MWLALTLLLVGLAGCEDPNTAMTGVWTAEKNAGTDLFRGATTLVLGQFGDEVAGYVEFRNRPGASGWAECSCSYIGGPFRVDVDAQTVQFSTACWTSLPTQMPGLDWKLARVTEGDTEVLRGEVTPSSGLAGAATVETVELFLETDSLPDPTARVCDPVTP